MKYRLVVDKGSTGGSTGLYEGLDPDQLAAVKAPFGPLLIVAGAGTGKTRTLIARVAHLMSLGADPERILVCTFTQRAARELVTRLNGMMGPAAQKIWAGTFHHIGHRLLRLHGETLGLGAEFSILDREDTQDLMASILQEKKVRAPLTARRLLGIFSQAIGRQVPVRRFVAENVPDLAGRSDEIIELFGAFTQKKITQRVVDFDDLLALWKIALKDHGETIRVMFDHVLVDEFQDTNRLQSDILDLMSADHHSLTAVGDDAQAIYSFRGAEPDNMLGFTQRHPQARICKLENNYRSCQEILDVANDALAPASQVLPKTLRAVRGKGTLPVLVQVQDQHQEAQFVAQRLWELHIEEGIPLHEIAILFRTNKQGLEMELELTRRGIPFMVSGGLRIFEQAHFKDFIAYLRVLKNPIDEIALYRLFRNLPGLGNATAQKAYHHLTQMAQADDTAATQHPLSTKGLRDAVSPAQARRLEELGRFFEDLLKVKGDVRALMERILLHYEPNLRTRYDNTDDRLGELREFVSLSAQYDSVEQLLGDLGLQSGPVGIAMQEREKPESSVVLSTVHQAKGLEWRAVFILSMCEGSFPLIFSQGSDPELEEERRVFHVAVTRAQDYLHFVQPMLSGPTDRQRVFQRLSRYLAEIPSARYELWEIELVSPD